MWDVSSFKFTLSIHTYTPTLSTPPFFLDCLCHRHCFIIFHATEQLFVRSRFFNIIFNQIFRGRSLLPSTTFTKHQQVFFWYSDHGEKKTLWKSHARHTGTRYWEKKLLVQCFTRYKETKKLWKPHWNCSLALKLTKMSWKVNKLNKQSKNNFTLKKN